MAGSSHIKICVVIIPYFNYVDWVVLNGRMTTDIFVEAMRTLHGRFRHLFRSHEANMLIMDKASQHVQAIPQLEEMGNLRVHQWCAKSQDLNIIENLFGIWKMELKRRVRLLPRRITLMHLRYYMKSTIEDLIAPTTRTVVDENGESQEVGDSLLLNLSGSMPARIKLVKENLGHSCRY